MFASLKNKIREETGSDLSKITSSWRNGAFLSRTAVKDESTSPVPCSGGYGDSTSDSISPKLESYLDERLSEADVRQKLRERDQLWQQKLDQLRTELVVAQGEEAAVAQSVARAAATEAAAAAAERDAAVKQLAQLREVAAQAGNAQHRLDALTEEIELTRRERCREQTEYRVSLGQTESHLRELSDELALVKATLPPSHPHYQFDEQVRVEDRATDGGCGEGGERCGRERAVLRRQLQEARLALADVKTSWSGQIASLETQVARVSRQAGEEGGERRRALDHNVLLQQQLEQAHQHIAKLKQSLGNSEAKVARLSGEARTLAAELRDARARAQEAVGRVNELDCRLREAVQENSWLRRGRTEAREREAALAERTRAESAARELRLAGANALVAELRHDCTNLQRNYEKEKRDKDEALLRNAQMSQDLEMKAGEVRAHVAAAKECSEKIMQLESTIAQHRENQAACMIIQEKEATRQQQLERLEAEVKLLTESETKLTSTVDDLQGQLAEKKKKIKSLERNVSDMKKTLARELASGKSELTSAEEAEISRRYLKHVVLRFVTAREEARQLTRALSVLLRLSAQEEAALQAALPPPTTLASWFAGLSPI